MILHAFSALQIQSHPLPGPSAVLRMADSSSQLASIRDTQNALTVLDLVFNDAGDDFGLVRAPNADDACRILEYAASSNAPHFVAQCQVGIGRSQAVIAALAKVRGIDPSPIIGRGTYNHRLYRLLLTAAGLAVPPGPLMSMAVRVKYAADRLNLFLLSMQRQRHTEWEVVAVTDGENRNAKELVDRFADPRIRLIETEKALGRWGHPYRQLGFDACRGQFIGASNDDNYYVPGYLEQMLFALESNSADMAVCQILHSYAAWGVTPGGDMGAWIARSELVRRTPWVGVDFTSDQDYIRALRSSSRKVVEVPRPLFVHN